MKRKGKAKTIVLLTVMSFALVVFCPQGWAADDYPNKPIQLICPFATGGITDLTARVIADGMGKYLGQPLVVINKPGAASALGTGIVAGSKPDGYTLLTTWIAIVLVPLINPNLPWKMSDIKPIGKTVVADQILEVNKNLPVKTIPELIAYAKAHPKTLSYGTAGVGTLPHLVMEMFNGEVGTDIQHIPYNSELQAGTALVGGHVQVSVLTYASSGAHIRSGAVRALAVLAKKRDPELPNVPTSAEQGYPDLLSQIYGIMGAPAKTPAPIIKKLEDALEKTLKDKDVRDKLQKMEYRPDFLNSADCQKFLDAEVKKWAPVVKKANVVIK